jgi:EAL domain-containing protein (putative c-di-GMP-specific phosphodiesterase class I)
MHNVHRFIPPGKSPPGEENCRRNQHASMPPAGRRAFLRAASGISGCVARGLVIEDIHDTIAKMEELNELDIHFSIDEFGTGYSSLAYLKRMPLRELRIDRTFVQNVPQDTNDVALMETILSVARHLNLSVVAEGVETEAQFAFLKSRLCGVFQGYLFDRPLPWNEFREKWPN